MGEVGIRNTGTTIRFWPDAKYFDSTKLSLSKLKHVLRAKAVLCPGLLVRLNDEAGKKKEQWHYENGIKTYLSDALAGCELLPAEPFIGSMQGNHEAVDWAIHWLPEDGELICESYVNLVPTLQGRNAVHAAGLEAA